jgi:predicted N-formylglutamate amidohydrolase
MASSGYEWTPEAQARLERVPEGFMRDCTRALIQKHADRLGTKRITIEVANEGITQAKGAMEEAMKSGNLKDIIERLTDVRAS